MSILSATIRLRDQFTTTLSSIHRRTNSFISRARILSNMVIRPVVKIRDMATSAIRKIRGSLLSLEGLATTVMVGVGINKLGDATIGEAAKSELSLITMGAILKSEKQAKEFFNWLSEEANRTAFNDQEMMTLGTSLAPYARDVNTFQKYVRMAEVLAAINPAEGLEGAGFALKEALSGDFVSLQERFNLPRSVINKLKEGKTTAEEFYEVVRKAAEAQGFDYKLVEKQAKSAIGLWQTITGTIGTFFRKAGEGILNATKPRLEKITEWFDKHPDTVKRWKDNLVAFGRQGADMILSAFESTFSHIITTYLDNPKFQKLNFVGKVNFIMGDIGQAISSWLDNGGSETLKTFGTRIGDFIGQGLMSVAPSIGRAAGSAVISAFTAALQSSFLGSIIIGALGGAAVGSIIPGAGTALGAIAGAGAGAITWGVSELVKDTKNARQSAKPKKKALGMRYVPYDNYPALLHRGEQVLTRAEADQYRNKTTNNNPVFNIIINGMNKTTREIVAEMVRELRLAQANKSF